MTGAQLGVLSDLLVDAETMTVAALCMRQKTFSRKGIAGSCLELAAMVQVGGRGAGQPGRALAAVLCTDLREAARLPGLHLQRHPAGQGVFDSDASRTTCMHSRCPEPTPARLACAGYTGVKQLPRHRAHMTGLPAWLLCR